MGNGAGAHVMFPRSAKLTMAVRRRDDAAAGAFHARVAADRPLPETCGKRRNGGGKALNGSREGGGAAGTMNRTAHRRSEIRRMPAAEKKMVAAAMESDG